MLVTSNGLANDAVRAAFVDLVGHGLRFDPAGALIDTR